MKKKTGMFKHELFVKIFVLEVDAMQKYEVQLLQRETEKRGQATYCQVVSLQSSSLVCKDCAIF